MPPLKEAAARSGARSPRALPRSPALAPSLAPSLAPAIDRALLLALVVSALALSAFGCGCEEEDPTEPPRDAGGVVVEDACGDAGVCQAGSDCVEGRCVPRVSEDGGPTLLPAGDPCASDGACASGLCLPEARGGVCSVPCDGPLSCVHPVPFSASCGAIERGGEVEKACVPYQPGAQLDGEPCARDDECESFTCSAGVCAQGCADAQDCPRGMECGEASYGGGHFEGCSFPSGNPYEVALPVVHVAVGYGTSVSRVALPRDAASVTLQGVVTEGEPLPLAFYTVQQGAAASPTTLFDLEGLYRYEAQPNHWLPLDGFEVVTMLVPNSTPDRVALAPGAIRFGMVVMPRREGDLGRVSFEQRVLVRRGEDPGTGTIDVAIHLVGVGVTASAAPSHARVSAMLSRFDAIFAQVGLRRGETSFHDVDAPSLAVIDSDEGPESELAQLFRYSAARSGRVLSLFLVRSIETGGRGFNTLGIAGGIPGPVGVHGTMHSGVAIAFDSSVVGDGRMAGQIAAHESGHYLGLFHVTEQGRACADGESPEATSCVPFGGGDTLADTPRGDTSNLMHWSIVGGGTNISLSDGQGHVLRRSGLVSWP